MSGSCLLLGAAYANAGGMRTGGGATPVVSVTTFSELANRSPVDGQMILVTANISPAVTDCVVAWSSIDDAWLAIRFFVASAAVLPGANPIYNSGSVVVAVAPDGLTLAYASDSGVTYEYTGSGWIATDEVAQSVATFSLLPSLAPVGHRCAVTGETGITMCTVRCTASNTWVVESIRPTQAMRLDNQWANAGVWYNSGGITVSNEVGSRLITSQGNGYRWHTYTSVLTYTGGMWLPDVIYSLTTKDLVGWLSGTEASGSLSTLLANQGLSVQTSSGGGSITSVDTGTRVQLDATYAGSSSSIVLGTATASGWSTSTQYYFAGLVTVPTFTGSAQLTFDLMDGSKRVRMILAATLGVCPAASTTPQAEFIRDNERFASEAFFEIIADAEYMWVLVNGEIYSGFQRASFGATTNKTATITATASASGRSVVAKFRRLQIQAGS